ncbi:hypothetical protein IFR04_009257 [Cadophora malorum]|uniref:Uncharacterized protein n=1 Tax=Cadophora malorum TaxID=108018 RepID=A0A8H7W6X8_9HELO|nr:hypothetical protein IFR04_009257 [Cadophora malorum]
MPALNLDSLNLNPRDLLHHTSHIQKRSAIGDFFTLPMVLGMICLLFVGIGIAAFVKIWRGDTTGRTMPGR